VASPSQFTKGDKGVDVDDRFRPKADMRIARNRSFKSISKASAIAAAKRSNQAITQ
jgi:hypothetical protein